MDLEGVDSGNEIEYDDTWKEVSHVQEQWLDISMWDLTLVETESDLIHEIKQSIPSI